ncbi:hypothetical protein G6011_07592 [Alternaria panax]|uniref:Uncharacterized protein n=1 Tax=Alternaria panax TaxID=48097 RepID=A0AAD4FF28_9PLEO|nr:hypothetical protein G6011_07592 [Alternaria panax]
MDNRKAQGLFRECPDQEDEALVTNRFISEEIRDRRTFDIWRKTVRKIETVVDARFRNMGAMPPNLGITANLCWPSVLVPDPGFALYTDDSWYSQGNNRDAYVQYDKDEHVAQFTSGKINQYTWGWTNSKWQFPDEDEDEDDNGNGNNGPPSDSDSDTDIPDNEDDDSTFPGGRRSLEDLDNFKRSPNEPVIHKGNATRQPTEEELFMDLGLLRCENRYCLKEMEQLGYASLPVVHETTTSPATVEAVATASSVANAP